MHIDEGSHTFATNIDQEFLDATFVKVSLLYFTFFYLAGLCLIIRPQVSKGYDKKDKHPT
jgi:hypothetical protein